MSDEDSLGCAGCGSCCNPVRLPRPKHVHFVGDPESLAFSIKYWRELPPNGESMFRYRCVMYNPVTRHCEAHDKRPPVCSGFPWYGQRNRSSMRTAAPVEFGPGGTVDGEKVEGTPVHCSYLRDVPSGWRPPNAHPLIPITPVNKSKPGNE